MFFIDGTKTEGGPGGCGQGGGGLGGGLDGDSECDGTEGSPEDFIFIFIFILIFIFIFIFSLNIQKNGILLPKLFWPTVRKKCSSDQEKFLNSRLKAENSQNFWNH